MFLFKGHIHILPLSFRPLEEDEPFKVTQEVLNFIRTEPEKSIVSSKVEQAIKKRIGCYPQKLADITFDTVVYVPVAVAALLEKYPKLVTASVRAFCDRDLLDIRVCFLVNSFQSTNFLILGLPCHEILPSRTTRPH